LREHPEFSSEKPRISEKRVSKEEKPNHAVKMHAINQDGSLALKLQYKVIVVICDFLCVFSSGNFLGTPKGTV
jgi:predicted house-cleaning NTP pyrophosphatase (Maf/HAM1 superfamily)